ncbi:MAG TPA: ATP-binding protein [Opitutaceae bacterium]|nr:ATP-binding protein [Opitutaceae bacterium]
MTPASTRTSPFPAHTNPGPGAAFPSATTLEEQRILIFAPIGNDALLTATFLMQAGLSTQACASMRNLADRVKEGCGLILLAEETLNPQAMPVLSAALSSQPSWSDIPVIIVTSASELSQIRLQRLELLGRDTNVSLLERPFRAVTLQRMAEVALRTRLRQYQVRDLLGEVQRSESRVRRILEQTAVGLAELDLDGKFTLVNEQFCAMVRRPHAELLGLRITDIVHPDDQAASISRRNMLKSGHASRSVIEKRYLRPDSSVVWVQDHLSIIRDPFGSLCGIAVASADITDRKFAEEIAGRARDEAVAASRAKDDFLAALSHELRTPLNPVLLLASEGAGNLDYPKTARDDFETIQRNVSLEARLFDDLLDLTRITRGKLSIDPRTHDLHSSLRDALTTVAEDARLHRLKLQLNLSSADAAVHGDPVRLQQVFWNVLKNAVKFTPDGGTITITTRTTKDRAVVTITDTGMGMNPDEMNRIFDTFAQGDHAAGHGAHRFGGLGLGLAISKTLIELHGGTIAGESGGRGLGSTFTIELPLVRTKGKVEISAAPRPAESPPPFPASGDTRRRRALVVEDHEPTRVALARLLTRRNFEVSTAGSVAEALSVAARTGIELILSDIGLPDGTGYDVMRELSTVHGVRGIALTGYGQEQDIAQSRAAGFAAHLTKPIDVRSLDKALDELSAMSAA